MAVQFAEKLPNATEKIYSITSNASSTGFDFHQTLSAAEISNHKENARTANDEGSRKPGPASQEPTDASAPSEVDARASEESREVGLSTEPKAFKVGDSTPGEVLSKGAVRNTISATRGLTPVPAAGRRSVVISTPHSSPKTQDINGVGLVAVAQRRLDTQTSYNVGAMLSHVTTIGANTTFATTSQPDSRALTANTRSLVEADGNKVSLVSGVNHSVSANGVAQVSKSEADSLSDKSIAALNTSVESSSTQAGSSDESSLDGSGLDQAGLRSPSLHKSSPLESGADAASLDSAKIVSSSLMLESNASSTAVADLPALSEATVKPIDARVSDPATQQRGQSIQRTSEAAGTKLPAGDTGKGSSKVSVDSSAIDLGAAANISPKDSASKDNAHLSEIANLVASQVASPVSFASVAPVANPSIHTASNKVQDDANRPSATELPSAPVLSSTTLGPTSLDSTMPFSTGYLPAAVPTSNDSVHSDSAVTPVADRGQVSTSSKGKLSSEVRGRDSRIGATDNGEDSSTGGDMQVSVKGADGQISVDPSASHDSSSSNLTLNQQNIAPLPLNIMAAPAEMSNQSHPAAQGNDGSSSSGSPAQASVDNGSMAYQAAPAINNAQLIQSMNHSEMRLGMHSTEFGNLSISTSVNHQSLSAQISTEHAELGRALAMHLPAIQEKLGSAYGMQARVEIRDGGSSSSYSNSGHQSKENRQGHSQLAHGSAVTSIDAAGVSTSSSIASMYADDSRLDIRV